MKTLRISLLCMVLVVLSVSVGHAQDQQWNLTLKGGPLFPGTVTIDPGGDVDTDMGWLLNAYIDAMVAPKLSFGGFLLLAGTNASGGGKDSGATVATLGMTVKGRFKLQSGLQLRPGLAFGYQMISGDAFDGVKGLDIGGIFEVVKPLANNKNALVGEVGFITQPAGGNSDADVTFGPIIYFAFGYEFGG
jgi:hypothetical protein